MKTIIMGAIAGAAASALIGSTVFAQNVEEITVQGTRSMTVTLQGRTSSGIPIKDVSMSYGVSYAGLDLVSHAGVLELQKRVTDAALAACKEIGRQYPDSTPSEADCAKAATDKAIAKVNELAAAAASKK
jgi:UrcA family protein